MPKITLTIDVPEESAQNLIDGLGIVLISAAYIFGSNAAPSDAVPTTSPNVQWQPLAYLRNNWDLDANNRRINERIQVMPWKLCSMFTLATED